MSIRQADGPPGGREILAQAIAPLVAREISVASRMAARTEEGTGLEVDLAAPHEVFVAGLRDVAEGRLLAAAQRQGWRYLVARGERAVGSAPLRFDARSNEWTFSHLTRGRYVDATVRAIDAAVHAEQVKEDEYDLRLLDIPVLHLRTLWLHADASDLLVPLAPTPGRLRPDRVYTEQELLGAVRELATAWLVSADDGEE
jgi:hypothetical protein